MACDPPVSMDLEQLFLESIGPSATYSVAGTVLTWTTPTATWTFDHLPPTPDEPLVDTEWVLNGILYQGSAMTGVGIDAGHIVFAADGTVSGSTSCRDFTGRWSIDGDSVVVDSFTLVGECVGPVSPEFDATFAGVLDEGFVGRIDGTKLEARPRVTLDLGLDFFAEVTD